MSVPKPNVILVFGDQWRAQDTGYAGNAQVQTPHLDRFAAELESRMADKLPAVNKIAFMQELGWETESWKWRQRAYAGDLIHARIWKFRKPEA